MDNKGITVGEVKEFATRELYKCFEQIINAKQARREPYYMLVLFGEGYHGPLAKGNNNYLLHGTDKREKRSVGVTKDMDLSGLKVIKQTIQIMEEYQVPPLPLIGTALLKVDNKRGSVEFVYILPPDKPMVSGFEVEEQSEVAEQCGAGMPYVYGGN